MMIVCGDAQQNRTLWVKEFRKWAWRYPRLMFASIDVEEASSCRHSSRHNKMREELLGFKDVNGLSFNSIAPGNVMEPSYLDPLASLTTLLQAENPELSTRATSKRSRSSASSLHGTNLHAHRGKFLPSKKTGLKAV